MALRKENFNSAANRNIKPVRGNRAFQNMTDGPTGDTGATAGNTGVVVITFISQASIDAGNGVYTITTTGVYCPSENLTGTIVIGANHCCIDLCCFTLNANGKDHAIIVKNIDDFQILDGTIYGSKKSAIFVENCNTISMGSLRLFGHELDMVHITNTNTVLMVQIDFNSNYDSERAINLENCSDVSITLCNVSGFVSTVGSLVQLVNCDSVTLQELDIFGNIKSLDSSNSPYDTSAAFVHLDNSTGSNIQYVQISNNTIDNKNLGNRYVHGLSLTNCVSGSLYQVEVSQNFNISGVAPSPVGSIATDSLIFIANSSSFICIDNQTSNHIITVPTTNLFGTHVINSNNITFYGCQSNGNYVEALPANPSVTSSLIGFYMENTQVNPTEDNVISFSQANFNHVNDGDNTRVEGGLIAQVFGIVSQGSITIEQTLANHNTMGTSGPAQRVGGILGIGCQNVTVTNTSCDNNLGGEFAVGIQVKAFNNTSQFNTKIGNCNANYNDSYGICIGDPLANETDMVNNVTIANCICNKNGSATHDAAGIVAFNNVGNVLIKCCQINETYSFANPAIASGIYIKRAMNVTIDDTIVNCTAGTCAEESVSLGHGILLDSVRNCKVMKCQVTDNQNSGIEIKGCNNNSVSVIDCTSNCNENGYKVCENSSLTNGLFKGNVAMNNSCTGFKYGPSTFSTGYISNYAQGNATDYDINGGVISLQHLGFNNGKTHEISGNHEVSYWSNITAS